jgi:flagellar basal body-associated protein FliL
MLILTAEFGEGQNKSESEIIWFLIELAVFTVLILALVLSIRLMSQSGTSAKAERA